MKRPDFFNGKVKLALILPDLMTRQVILNTFGGHNKAFCKDLTRHRGAYYLDKEDIIKAIALLKEYDKKVTRNYHSESLRALGLKELENYLKSKY